MKHITLFSLYHSQFEQCFITAPINIQSQDYRNLLDIIDKFRSQGHSRCVGLPEIVVCSDQSSGKSSVFKAISGLSFLTKDNLYKRFDTELILRRHLADARVSIVPHHSRSEIEKERLLAFTAKVDPDHPDVGPVAEAAKVVLGLVDVDNEDKDSINEIGSNSAPNAERFSTTCSASSFLGPSSST